MNARGIFTWGFISLFLISLFVFHFYLRPDKFSNVAFFQSLIVSSLPVLYLLIRNYIVVDKSPSFSMGIYTNLSPIIALLVAIVVVFCLLYIDLDSLRISRDVIREKSFLIRLINLHIVIVLFVCVYTFSKSKFNNESVKIFWILMAFL
ncbi:hypothetical protein CXF78_01635, partial [Shewanella sp. 11B5]|uniref:hypothetical protein n=1 Tax=Shewanella sp. 11B5 TaxID=2058298 RepID=UPI000CC4B38B